MCLNTTLVLKVHCTFPETSKIKCSTSLRLHPITAGKRARAGLHDFDPASYIFWVGAPNASKIDLNWDLRILCDPDWPRHCCNFSLIGNFFKWRLLVTCASTLYLCRECTAHSQNLLKFSAPLVCAFPLLQATKLELVFGILTLPPTFFKWRHRIPQH